MTKGQTSANITGQGACGHVALHCITPDEASITQDCNWVEPKDMKNGINIPLCDVGITLDCDWMEPKNM